MTEAAKEYLQYVHDVLGVRSFLTPHEITADPEGELSHWASTRTGHWPEPSAHDLIVLHLGIGVLFEGESEALWTKMKAAMKLEGREVLEVETRHADIDGVLLRLLEPYPAAVALVLSPAPSRNPMWRALGSAQILETFSPEVLLSSPDLKRTAWGDLQAVMRSL